jgi:hypothetical protein
MNKPGVGAAFERREIAPHQKPKRAAQYDRRRLDGA